MHIFRTFSKTILRGLVFVCFAFSCPSAHAQSSVPDVKPYHGDGIDNILQYVPNLANFGLKACGLQGKSDWQEKLTASVVGIGVNAGVTYALKHTVKRTRPDGTDDRSFPSGHTSIAFCGATLLCHEYGHRYPAIAVGGYAIAATVAVDRVCRNRHHWSDVATGAAIGILSAEAGYWTSHLINRRKKKQDSGLSLTPTGMYLVVQF